MTCVGLVQHLEGEAKKNRASSPRSRAAKFNVDAGRVYVAGLSARGSQARQARLQRFFLRDLVPWLNRKFFGSSGAPPRLSGIRALIGWR
jgi:hypothetical protein